MGKALDAGQGVDVKASQRNWYLQAEIQWRGREGWERVLGW